MAQAKGRVAKILWLLATSIGSLLDPAVRWGQDALPPRSSESSPCYSYRFEHPHLDPSRMELRFDATGRGTFSFWRQGEEEPIVLPLQLLASTVERVKGYLDALHFLESTEEYQAEREMPSLGTVTLSVSHGERQRRVRFTFTRNEKMRELAHLLRGIAMQEYRVFLISMARQYGPLDLDKQLRGLESELKNGWLGEPEKLLPLLRELQQDEDLLLIVRHRAERLRQWIERQSQRSEGNGPRKSNQK